MASIDFEAFKERVSLEDVAKLLCPSVPRLHGGWTRIPCPVCKHADNRCCHFRWDRSLFYCHRCKAGGAQVTFAALVLVVNTFEAVKIVCNRLGIGIPWKQRVRARRRHRDRDGTIIDDTDDDDVIG